MKAERIIIFSDVHASMEALNKVCEYMDKEQINVALNLGDFISGGQYPCEVFDKLTEDQRFINIKGYDEECLYDSIKADEGIGQGRWLIQKLGTERVDKLRKIPSVREVQINGISILMSHHNGWADLAQLRAHTESSGKRYEIIAYGGSHMQELTHNKEYYNNAIIIDPGALKPNTIRQGKFAVVSFEKKEPEIRFQTMDVEETGNSIGNQEEIKYEKEKQEAVQDTFLYIKNQAGDRKAIPINDKVIDKIIEIGSQKCKYVSIGCWHQEKHIIKELLYYLKCRLVKTAEDDEQEWYVGEVTDSIKKLLLNNRKLSDGRMKWFEVSFQDKIENGNVLYSIYHYGKEGFLKRLTAGELFTMEELLNKYDIVYSLPE